MTDQLLEVENFVRDRRNKAALIDNKHVAACAYAEASAILDKIIVMRGGCPTGEHT